MVQQREDPIQFVNREPGSGSRALLDEGLQKAGIDSSKVPGFLWQSAEEVANGALTALDHNRAVYVPGTLNRLTAGIVSVLPDALTRRATLGRLRLRHRPHCTPQPTGYGPLGPLSRG